MVVPGESGVDRSSERGINSLKWITALCQEHCRNTSDYWEDGISAFLYRLAGCQRMLFPVVGGRWLGRIGSVIEIMHFYRSFRAFSSRCCLSKPDVGRYCYGWKQHLKCGFYNNNSDGIIRSTFSAARGIYVICIKFLSQAWEEISIFGPSRFWCLIIFMYQFLNTFFISVNCLPIWLDEIVQFFLYPFVHRIFRKGSFYLPLQHLCAHINENL